MLGVNKADKDVGLLADPPRLFWPARFRRAAVTIRSYSVLRDPIFVNWSSISLPHYVKGSDYVPVTAFRIVTGLSDGIPRRQAFDAPQFGHNVLVANHDEDFGVRCHCK